MRRTILLVALITFVLTPFIAIAAKPTNTGFSPLYEVDIWIDPLDSHAFYYEGAREGDTLPGSFEVTSGTDISFFICDIDDYDDWSDGYDVAVPYIRHDVGSHSYSFEVPYDDTWYIVFVNDDWLFSRHIEGDIYLTPASVAPSTAGIGAAGVALVLLIFIVIIGAAAYDHSKKSQSAVSSSPSHYANQQPLSRHVKRPEAFCPYCGARRLPNSQFCSQCGNAFGEGPKIG